MWSNVPKSLELGGSALQKGSIFARMAAVVIAIGAFGGVAAAGAAPALAATSAPRPSSPAAYPPATTGTFSLTAKRGPNRFTISGLTPNATATAEISGTGALPGAAKGSAVTLVLGRTDSTGRLTFALDFPSGASGIYNVSVLTPGSVAAAGVVTIEGTVASSETVTPGTPYALWFVIGGAVIVVGAIVGVMMWRLREPTE